jgi:hypothetical protein
MDGNLEMCASELQDASGMREGPTGKFEGEN